MAKFDNVDLSFPIEKFVIITTKQKALNLLQEQADRLESVQTGGDLPSEIADEIRTAIAWLKEC